MTKTYIIELKLKDKEDDFTYLLVTRRVVSGEEAIESIMEKGIWVHDEGTYYHYPASLIIYIEMKELDEMTFDGMVCKPDKLMADKYII